MSGRDVTWMRGASVAAGEDADDDGRAMLRGRAALASVFLCSVCVLALRQPARRSRCSTDLIRRVEVLQQNVTHQEWLDCSLYTPSIADVQNCPRSALTCFAAEVNVLTKELVDSGMKYISKLQISSGLERLAKQSYKTGSACPPCESFMEKNVTMFLKDLLLTLKMLYNDCTVSATGAPPFSQTRIRTPVRVVRRPTGAQPQGGRH